MERVPMEVTRQDRIYCLKASSDYHSEVCEECKAYPNCDHMTQDDMTELTIKDLEVLEQQTSEDCVDREELKKWLDMNFSFGGALRKIELFDRLDKELPPVTPTRMKGRWIKVTETEFGNGYQCSECGRFILTESIDGKKLKDFPYCHCGAEMESDG